MSSEGLKLLKPTYTEDELNNTPWNTLELKIWDTLATTVELPAFAPEALAEELSGLLGSGPEPSAEGFLWRLWYIFILAAGQVPVWNPGQQRLVELLTALRDLPNPVPLADLQATPWGDLKLWSDLPLLGPAIRDALNEETGINIHAFIARLTLAGLSDFWWLALCFFRDALEMEHPKLKMYDEYVEGLDYPIPIAAIWIRLAGSEIYEMSLLEKMSDTFVGQGGSWQGQPGFSAERWDAWKLKFDKISKDCATNAQTRNVAAEAKNIMDGIDGQLALFYPYRATPV